MDFLLKRVVLPHTPGYGPGQAHSQKILLGNAFEEKVDLSILYHSPWPGAVEEIVIVGCMHIAHIHEG